MFFKTASFLQDCRCSFWIGMQLTIGYQMPFCSNKATSNKEQYINETQIIS